MKKPNAEGKTPAPTSHKKGFKEAKTTAIRKGTYEPKVRAGRKASTRLRKPSLHQRDPDEDADDPLESDNSEDGDYEEEEDNSEEEEEISEEELDVLEAEDEEVKEEAEDLQQVKDFADYLDGSSKLHKIYLNGRVVREMPLGQVKLESWMIFSSKDHFLGIFRDYYIEEGFNVRVERADNSRFTATCIIDGCNWRVHASIL